MATTFEQKQMIGTLTNLSYIYINHHKPKRALEYLRFAQSIDPAHKGVKRMMAVAYMDAGFPRHALQTLEELEEMGGPEENDKAPVALIKSMSYHHLNDSENAQAFLAEYIQLREQRAEQ